MSIVYAVYTLPVLYVRLFVILVYSSIVWTGVYQWRCIRMGCNADDASHVSENLMKELFGQRMHVMGVCVTASLKASHSR